MKGLFYLTAGASLFSGWSVITSKSPILSVFWLVVAFANVAFLLILLGVEFLPILFIIVYVGAIAILFLFVVMLLNIKLVEIGENATRYVPMGIVIGLIFLYQIYFSMDFFGDQTLSIQNVNIVEYVNIHGVTNIEQIGDLLYTDYWLYFIVSSLILLVSMIGAIVLCLFHEESVKRQDLFGQIATEYTRTVRTVK